MKKFLRITISIAVIVLVIAGIVFGPYVLRVQHFRANPTNGYSADFCFYLSPDVKRMVRNNQVVTILVQPNNSGGNSDDLNVHRRDAWWTGFEHRGMFANRFTILHPERVKAATIGSPGGWPIAPAASSNGQELPYSAGISDLETLTQAPFNSGAYNAIPQLVYMGSTDDNDSLDYRDGWDEEHARVVDGLFGEDPLSRWQAAEAIYRETGANVQFLLVEGIGHDRKALQNYSTDFFKKVLNGE